MKKFKDRCRIIYLGEDGDFDWVTITVDVLATIVTVAIIFYVLTY